jgi:hypothetical protein
MRDASEGKVSCQIRSEQFLGATFLPRGKAAAIEAIRRD